MRDLTKRIEALEARRPDRLVVARWVEGGALGWFGTRPVPVADIPRLTAEAQAAGCEVLHIVRSIVDPPPRPEALHWPPEAVALATACCNRRARFRASARPEHANPGRFDAGQRTQRW